MTDAHLFWVGLAASTVGLAGCLLVLFWEHLSWRYRDWQLGRWAKRRKGVVDGHRWL